MTRPARLIASASYDLPDVRVRAGVPIPGDREVLEALAARLEAIGVPCRVADVSPPPTAARFTRARPAGKAESAVLDSEADEDTFDGPDAPEGTPEATETPSVEAVARNALAGMTDEDLERLRDSMIYRAPLHDVIGRRRKGSSLRVALEDGFYRAFDGEQVAEAFLAARDEWHGSEV